MQYVPNKTSNRYPFWEATTEPVYEAEDDNFLVHERHFAVGPEGSRTLLKSSMVEFALAEYSNGYFPQTLTQTRTLTPTLTLTLTLNLTLNLTLSLTLQVMMPIPFA